MVSRPSIVSIRLVIFFRRNATIMKYPGPEAQHYLFNDVLARKIQSQGTMKSKSVRKRRDLLDHFVRIPESLLAQGRNQ